MSVAEIPKVELHVHLEGTAPPALVRRIAERNGLRLPEGLLAGARPLRLARLPGLPEDLRPRRERHPHRPGLPRRHLRVPGVVRRRGRDLRRAHRRDPERPLGRPRRRRALGGHRRGDRRRAPRPRHRGPRAVVVHPQLRRRRGDRGRRAHRRRARIPTSSASRWPATRPATRPSPSPMPMRSPPRRASGARCTPASGPARTPCAARWSCPASRASATACGRSRIPSSSPSSRGARSCSRPARRRTSSWACSTATPAIRCPPCAPPGVRVTLASDDPPYFGASIGGEYAVASERFGLSDDELRAITADGVRASFAEPALREELLAGLTDDDGARR